MGPFSLDNRIYDHDRFCGSGFEPLASHVTIFKLAMDACLDTQGVYPRHRFSDVFQGNRQWATVLKRREAPSNTRRYANFHKLGNLGYIDTGVCLGTEFGSCTMKKAAMLARLYGYLRVFARYWLGPWVRL